VAIALIASAAAQVVQVEPFKLSDVMAPVPIPEKFAPGWKASDPQSGISIEIIRATSTPRCLEEKNCPWIIEWRSAKKGERSEVMVQAKYGHSESYESADPKVRAKFTRHTYPYDPTEVEFISITIWNGHGDHEREIARALFR